MANNYIKFFIINSVVLLGLIPAVILYVDPTGLLSQQGLTPSWGCTGGVRTNVYDVKSVSLAIHDYDSVIIGTSRVGAGFNTTTFSTITGSSNAYNAGISGLHSSNLEHYLAILSKRPVLKNLYIALDMGMFMSENPEKNTGTMLKYLNDAAEPPSVSHLILRAHANKETFISSFQTLINRSHCHTPKITSQGHFSVHHRTKRIIRDGYIQKARTMIEGQKKRILAYLSSMQGDTSYTALQNKVRMLDQHLERFCRSGVSIRLFTNPVHAEIIKTYDNMMPGANNIYLRTLVSMVSRHQQKGCPIDLWDYTVIHPYTTAAFPDNHNPDDPSTYFWEPAHYKNSLGEIILNEMNGLARHDFGVKLTPENIDSHILKQNKLIREYRQQHSYPPA